MQTNKGNSVIAAILILAVLVGGGYLYYRGANIEKDAMEQELPEIMVENENSMGGEGIVEIGAEDEMMTVPEGSGDVMGSDEMMADDGMMNTSAREFDVEAKNFEYSMKEIRVKKGDKVRINFKSTNGFHDWVVDEFNARTAQINTGGTSSAEFTADKTGTFEFYCSVGTHRQMGMVGKLIVE